MKEHVLPLAKKIGTGTQAKRRRVHARQITRLCHVRAVVSIFLARVVLYHHTSFELHTLDRNSLCLNRNCVFSEYVLTENDCSFAVRNSFFFFLRWTCDKYFGRESQSVCDRIDREKNTNQKFPLYSILFRFEFEIKYCKSRIFRMHFIFVYFVRSGFRTKI